jgi:hypothetical protein
MANQLIGEAALADAGLASQQEQAPTAGEHIIQTAE